MVKKMIVSAVAFLGLGSLGNNLMALDYYVAHKIGEAAGEAAVSAREKQERKENVFSDKDIKEGFKRGGHKIGGVSGTLTINPPQKTGKSNVIVYRVCEVPCGQIGGGRYFAIYSDTIKGTKNLMVYVYTKVLVKDKKTGKYNFVWKQVTAVEWAPVMDLSWTLVQSDVKLTKKG